MSKGSDRSCRNLPAPLLNALQARAAAGAMIGTGGFPSTSGAYCLAFYLAGPVTIALPRRPAEMIKPGWYLYFGSAYGPGGLRARLARHFRSDKSLRWHIDHLTVAADHLAALAVPGGNECALRAEFAGSLPTTAPHIGFGSSDCRICPSHLLKWEGE